MRLRHNTDMRFTKGSIAAVVVLVVSVMHAPSRAADKLTPMELGQVRVGGEIGRRIDATVNNNLLVLEADKDFLAPFVKRERSSGYIGLGKLIDATVRFAAYGGDARVLALKKHLVDKTIELQEDDGYVGMFVPESRMKTLWDVHEMAYIVYGLLSDYQYFHDDRSLAAARKAADYIIEHWPILRREWEVPNGVATYVGVTGLERSMLAMGRHSGDPRYQEFCVKERALDGWDPEIVIGRRAEIEGHIYAYMCRSLAQLELYRIRPDEELLQPTNHAIDFLLQTNGAAITGGAGQQECWTDDQDGRGPLAETCASAYLMRTYESLLRLEGDSRYGDLMERTLYNTLFAAQSPDGRKIRYYAPIEGPREYHPGDTYCCPCNYRRIVAELPGMIYYRTAKGMAINLYTASETTVEIDGGVAVGVRQETGYPSFGHVVIHLDPSRPAMFPLQLRIPAWCKEAKITVNGRAVEGPCGGGRFFTLTEQWKSGDRVVLDMPMPWRLVRGRQRQAGRVAVMRGPLVLCLNPQQHEELATWDAADLGRITLDPASLSEPVEDDSVRPGGIACRVQAWIPGYRVAPPGDLNLVFTEFPDPGGEAVYFRLHDLSAAVDDELFAPTR